MPDPTSPPPTKNAKATGFLSLGLKPFFLGVALFAILAIALWALSLQGLNLITPTYGMHLWHMHEMLFGYGSAVLAGFLLTAVPNWTGRKPLSGVGLGALWLVWLAGRVAMMLGAPPLELVTLDVSFLLLVIAVVTRDIVIARNWRNWVVLGPIALIALGNATFHVEAITNGAPDYGPRIGLGGLVFLVMLIGGRIIPAFSRNWLVAQGATRLPAAFSRFDAVVLLLSLAALALWVLIPSGLLTGAGLGMVALLHLLRLMRWCGLATLSNPLLFVLHAAYAMIPAGLALLGVAAGLDDPALYVAALHLLGIGVIGAMTLAVMSRASLGHTGQALLADRWLQAGLTSIFLSAFVRVLSVFSEYQPSLIVVSALLWIAGFSLFIARIGPGLISRQPR
ncbi:MAG: NnrS family protein [Rhodobacteraceae bacterium]|nr:NnrS family protein [Paracoccaceae bacterium]